MKYLITGGAGFVGSHLSEHLLTGGHEVSIIDDLSTGSAENIAHLRAHPGFHVTFSTIFDRPLMAELVDNCDVVVHLAAAVGVNFIIEHPVHTIETNVNGAELILQLASKKAKKVIIASTSEVYGKSNKIPFCESDDLVLGATVRNRWSYACSKAMDEFLALAYHRERKVPIVIVRLFNTVGPRQTGRYGMVIPRFVQQAMAGKPITVYGDGNQSRCFGYVGDVVAGIERLSLEPAAVGEVVNLGGEQEITINALAKMVRDAAASDSPIVHVPYSEAYAEGFEDMRRRVPSLEKAHRLIGYHPTLGTREIIDRVIAYFRARESQASKHMEAVQPAD